MHDEPLAYLQHRFATDAATLRARADQLAKRPPAHGPDAAASRRMADACDVVLGQLDALTGRSDDQLLVALERLAPEFESRALRAPDAFVRSVYGGAAARVHEVVERTRTAADADEGSGDEDTEPDEDLDEDELDGERDEDDFDDDELDDDEQADGQADEQHDDGRPGDGSAR